MLELKIKLYSFEELGEGAKMYAIGEHRTFLLETLRPDFIDGVTDWNDPEKMTMYNEEYDYILMNDEPVIENINANEYVFFADGTLCWTCQYIAGPKKGLTEIKIHGELFTLGGGASV